VFIRTFFVRSKIEGDGSESGNVRSAERGVRVRTGIHWKRAAHLARFSGREASMARVR